MLTAALVIVSLVIGCLGAGRALLGPAPAGERRPLADAESGLAGLALLTWLAGWLVVAERYSELAGWLLLALGCAGWLSWRPAHPATPRQVEAEPFHLRAVAVVLGALSLAIASVRVISEFVLPWYSTCDDFPSYFHFPRLLLETGGFIEPFSLRRLGTLGAVPFLQSYFWRDFATSAGLMADAVVGQLLIWSAARSIPAALAKRPHPAWQGQAFGLAGLLVSLTVLGGNSMPSRLPMAGALVLILLSLRMRETAGAILGHRSAIAWGLVAAWLIGLRPLNGAFPAVLWLASAFVAARGRDREQGARLAIAAAASLVSLLPWCLSLWQSSSTPLYPLFQGNYRYEGAFGAGLDLAGVVAFVANALWASRVWVLVLIAGFVIMIPGQRLPAIQVMLALVAMVALTAATLTGFDSFTIHRYCTPFLAAGTVFLAGAALTGKPVSWVRATRTRRVLFALSVWALIVLWLTIPVELRADRDRFRATNFLDMHGHLVLRGGAALRTWRNGLQVREHPGRRHYEEAQALLPADARLVSATDKPFFFRFDRQVVHTLDCLGQVSPEPGMPFFQGPEVLARYFIDLGYTHLAFTPPEASVCLYSRGGWEKTPDQRIFLWQRWAHYFLDFMDNVERLETSRRIVYARPDLVVIDLRDTR